MSRWTTSEQQVIEEVAAMVRRSVADTNEAWSTGRIEDSSTLLAVTDDFEGVQFAPWYEGAKWTGGRAEWDDGNLQAAVSAGPGHRWTYEDLCVLPRSTDEAVAVYTVVLEWPDRSRRPARAVFLETWRREGARWLLARHTAEKI